MSLNAAPPLSAPSTSPAQATVDNAPSVAGIAPTPYLQGKRRAVRLLSVVVGLALLPIIALLIVLVRLTSRGPGMYKQRRLGLDHREFTIYKLRSMRVDAESGTGPVWSGKGDPRVTPIGRVLRYLHLDELPQIINVIRGEMDFVGPRPERPEIARNLSDRIPFYNERLKALPGITGVAQVNLPPDETLDCVRKKLAADLYYVENATAWLDLRLVMATALRTLGVRYRDGAALLGVEFDPTSVEPKENETAPQSGFDTVADEQIGVETGVFVAHNGAHNAPARDRPCQPR